MGLRLSGISIIAIAMLTLIQTWMSCADEVTMIKSKTFNKSLDLVQLQKKHKATKKFKFSNCIFKHDVTISKSSFVHHIDIEFNNCKFQESLDLSNMKISGDLLITDCRFENSVSFNNLQSTRNITLSKSHIESEAIFNGLSVLGNLNLFDCYFGGNFLLQDGFVLKNTNLSNSRFKGYSDLSQSRFDGKFIANYTQYFDKLVLIGSEWRGDIFFRDAILQSIEIEDCHFAKDIPTNLIQQK